MWSLIITSTTAYIHHSRSIGCAFALLFNTPVLIYSSLVIKLICLLMCHIKVLKGNEPIFDMHVCQ